MALGERDKHSAHLPKTARLAALHRPGRLAALHKSARLAALVLLAGSSMAAMAQPARSSAAGAATYSVRLLTPEAALSAAQAALAACRAAGYQVAVAVVDRSGVLQVLLRDRLAGAHTVDLAPAKAWTAASTRLPTAELAADTQPGRPMSGLRGYPRFLAAGGGLVLEGGGSVLGAIGVSGAPGGEADDACARAGIKAVADELEF